ncbi:hypothetical protein H632_c3203p1 [Helicosporidium sp. ATCC 50920]|nr:hypothetical protein H632_c3203p1 [Helicosporidium sp. ATCC 50920]|eukprot:KDD72548.1 hypothetical protein H632_c3203p1 [Helicosporidium sp. ATCC 50920]
MAPCPQRRVIAPALTAAHMTQLILPQHANSIGITFGGWVMRWMEQCAWIAASRVARGAYLLTASLDTLAFLSPTRVGDILYVEAQATAIFGSSAELLISVWAETPEEGGLFECGDAYATVVSINDQGQPLDIPFELAPQTPQDHVRYRGALERRNARLAMRADLLAVQKRRPALDGVSERTAADDSAMHRALSSARGH